MTNKFSNMGIVWEYDDGSIIKGPSIWAMEAKQKIKDGRLNTINEQN